MRETSLYSAETHDAAGRTLATVNPLGARNTSIYDAAARRIVSENPLGHRTTGVLDAAGRTIATVDSRGHRSSFTFDAADQQVGTKDALGWRTSSGFFADGHRLDCPEQKEAGMADSTIQNPHDGFFKETFGRVEFTREFLAKFLPRDVATCLELTGLQAVKDSFDDDELRQSQSDLVFSVPLSETGEAIVYLLFEHKSYACWLR